MSIEFRYPPVCVCVCVLEFDAPIAATTTSGEQVALERAPRECLHDGHVVLEPMQPLVVARRWQGQCHRHIPNVQKVVVAFAGQLPP